MLTQNYFCSLFKSNTYISMLFNYIFIIFLLLTIIYISVIHMCVRSLPFLVIFLDFSGIEIEMSVILLTS